MVGSLSKVLHVWNTRGVHGGALVAESNWIPVLVELGHVADVGLDLGGLHVAPLARAASFFIANPLILIAFA